MYCSLPGLGENFIYNAEGFWLCYELLLVNVSNFADAQDPQLWSDFKTKYPKNYRPEEEQRRMEIFHDNMNKINQHNEKFKRGEESFEMGMNSFGDMTEDEFEQIYLSKYHPGQLLDQSSALPDINSIIIKTLPPHCGPIPDSKNWVIEGAATEVKDQKKCGCCWATAIAGVIELHHFIHTRQLVSLSAQNLLDCVGSHEGIPHSCLGGTMIFPLQYVVDNKGIDTECSYPYTEKQGNCAYKAENKGATIKGYKMPEPKNEELFKGIVGTIGPIACSFAAEKRFIQFYKSGIYSSKTCGKTENDVNHAIIIVGYGTENNHDYWLLKNSWGKAWGDNGYFKLRRGRNECGVAIQDFYPII